MFKTKLQNIFSRGPGALCSFLQGGGKKLKLRHSSVHFRVHLHTHIDDSDDNVSGPDADAATASVVKDANAMESASNPVAMAVASVAKQLRPDKQRASELRRIFGAGFVGVARRVWPGLRAVRMVSTGGFAAHARLLGDTYMQGVPQLSLVHAASEGFFGVNVTAADKGPKWLGPNSRYTVLPQLGFYEFIRVVDVEQHQPPTVFADQVWIVPLESWG